MHAEERDSMQNNFFRNVLDTGHIIENLTFCLLTLTQDNKTKYLMDG